MEDVSSVAFFIPKQRHNDPQLVGCYLFFPIGYMGSAAYFCATSDTATDMTNASMQQFHTAPPHTLDIATNTLAPEDGGGPTPSADAQ